MYLIDTNIWLERLLEQDRSREVHAFLTRLPSEQLCVTDFTFHSIGVILGRLKRTEAFRDFVQDVFIDGAVMIVALKTESMANVVEAMAQFRLDFDDAYQYVAAEIYQLTLVTFDGDFDRTDLVRKTPHQVTEI